MRHAHLAATCLLLALASPATAQCPGDCDASGSVTIEDLVAAVDVHLGDAPAARCPALDCGGDDPIDCIVAGVEGALMGCNEGATIEGPVTGGAGSPFVAATSFDLAQVGYTQAEYFISGTATAYRNVGELGDDGLWTVEPSDTAAYKTRILVYRPIDPADFKGTVVVEWLNVSGGLDAAPDWTMMHTELIRTGAAWVGVSAQKTGVEGGPPILGLPVMPLKIVDPVRYASLVHPGDSFSYDIYTQVARALRHPALLDALGGLQIETLIAVGESQSAFRMVTYINAVHPLVGIFDGFFVHSRGSVSAALAEAPQPPISTPGTARIRADVDVPVMIFETETDMTVLGYFPARQPDGDRIRTWEVAGTAHADTYTLAVGMADLGNSPDVANLVLTSTPVPGFSCPKTINSGPQHFVVKAALSSLVRWISDGTAPATSPRLEVDPGPPPRLRRDANGIVRGGIRLPQVDVPIATLSGEGQGGSLFCLLFGSTAPFSAEKLAALYPDHETYVAAYHAAADAALEAGFLLPPDAALMKAAASASDIGEH